MSLLHRKLHGTPRNSSTPGSGTPGTPWWNSMELLELPGIQGILRGFFQTTQRMATRCMGHRHRLLHERRTRALHRTIRQRPPAGSRSHSGDRRTGFLFHTPRQQTRGPFLLRTLRPLPHTRCSATVNRRKSARHPRPCNARRHRTRRPRRPL